jgi:hypothetical protein
MLYRFPYDDRCEAIWLYESHIAKAPNAKTLRQTTAPYKEQVSFNGETGVRAFHNYVKERHLFDDLLKMLKATPSARQVVVAGTPVLREQLTMYGRYACKHFRTQAETNFHAVYFLSLEGDNAYVGHHHSIYKVAVNALYTIKESND